MRNHNNTQHFLGNGLKIGSAIFLIVGASLIIPKIADAALALKHDAPEYAIPVAQDISERYPEGRDSSGYQPPDFGRPSSAYGSGTR
jgi:hypothetical protein